MSQPEAVTSDSGRAADPSTEVMRRKLFAAKTRLEGEKEDIVSRLALAEACFRLAVMEESDLDAAIAWMYEAAEHDPYHPKYFFHLGRLLDKNGDPQGAVFEYRRALNLAPRSHRTYVHLVLALERLDEQERKLGLRIITILATGQDAALAEVLHDLDQVIESKLDPEKGNPSVSRGTSSARSPTVDASERGCRWNGLWKLELLKELSRPKPLKKRLSQRLKEGRSRIGDNHKVGEYVLSLLFFLFDNPKTHRIVQGHLRDAGLDGRNERPSLELVHAACELGQADGALEFVDRAVELVECGVLPLDLVCCLHYCWYGSSNQVVVEDACTALWRYPVSLRRQPCFRELQVAVLDYYARQAWMDERFDQAEILWQESLGIDPFRVAVAHNLALVATHQGSPGKYARYWERATELRYLQAAAAGDVRVNLDERRKMHRAFARQAEISHRDKSRDEEGEPPEEELEVLITDRDALEIWLREWELYYVNSRLRFHSPVHLLGVRRDCADKDPIIARDILLRQLEIVLGGRDWAGIKVFRSLVEELLASACEQAGDPIARRRDRYYLAEEHEARSLLKESSDRGFLLLRMMEIAGKSKAPTAGLAVFQIARSLLAMPWWMLEQYCKKTGSIPYDWDLISIFFRRLINIVLDEQSTATKSDELEAKLLALEDCIAAHPRAPHLCLVKCTLLVGAGRNQEAYEIALEGLALLKLTLDRDDVKQLSSALVGSIDNAAISEVPENLLNPSSVEGAKRLIEAGCRVLADFPKAGGLRILIVKYLIQIGRQERDALDRAAELAEEGLGLALTEEQISQFQDLQREAGASSRSIAAIHEIRGLLESSAERTRRAFKSVQEERTPATLRVAREELELAIDEAMRAREIAVKAELAAPVEQANKLISQISQLLEEIDRE